MRESVCLLINPEAGVCGHAVFMHIQSIQLFLIGYPQTDGEFDCGEDDKGQYRRVYKNGCDSDELCNKRTALAKYAGKERADETAAAMDADSTDRVINADHLVNEFDGKYNDKAGDHTDYDRFVRGYDVAAGGDGDETGQSTV